MSTVDAAELFICSFCGQKMKISSKHIGQRIPCPSCKRIVRVFANRSQNIDEKLSSTWFYMRSRLLRAEEEIGPITDEHFVALLERNEITGATPVLSPRLTKGEWVNAAQLDLPRIKELIEQRHAEQQRRSQQEQRRQEIHLQNREILTRAIETVVSDGSVTLNERSKLLEFARAAGIPELEVESLISSEAERLVRTITDDFLADGILEPHELRRIEDVATALGVHKKLSDTQIARIELCELAWQLASGEFTPDAAIVPDVKFTANEVPLAICGAEWFEIVQVKKPVGIPLGDGHYLKPVAAGDCVVTNKRVLLIGAFTAKKLPFSSVIGARWYHDGLFFNRSSGKSVFLKGKGASRDWTRFAMIAQNAVTQEPVLGIEPTATFVPGIVEMASVDASLQSPPVWQASSEEPRYTFRVVGDHVGERAYWISQLKLGEPLYLLREPSNPHDENAVAVIDATRRQLGYLKREVAEWFAPMLDRGHSFNVEAYRIRESGALIVGVYDA